MADFALIGAAGFVAVRHMKAIAETGHHLAVAVDPNDSVGVLDQHFPNAHFFTEFERFESHLDQLRRKGSPVSFVSICSPNYLHEAHIRLGLRSDADVICEKPLVLDPADLEALIELERDAKRKVFTVLQLRLHPAIRALRDNISERCRADLSFKPEIELTYITSRGRWYHASWKGDANKSGGIATNIGIHFFDMLQWVFGAVEHSELHVSTLETAAGYIELEHARVRWLLSVDSNTLPPAVQARGQRTFRELTMEGRAIEFSEGFTDLHTETYRHILAGHGFGLSDAREAVKIAYDLRHATPTVDPRGLHPMARALVASAP